MIDPAGRPALLIVDDEDGPRQSLKIVFKEDYNIFLASDGNTAIELARKNKICVAILDILMAGMSGVELLRHLKEIDAGIEVIMLTAYETIETARHAIRYGACDYLNKPFDIPTIRATVARAVEKHRAAANLINTDQKLKVLQEQIQDQKLQEEVIRGKGEIYASVLHDINSPLTVISGYIDMINRSIHDAASVDGEALETIKDDLGKLTEQVGRCFEISRRYLSFLHAGEQTEHPQVGVNQILVDLKELLIRHPSAQAHTLIIQNLPQDVMAEINGTDLLQILLNLTLNAFQAGDQPHKVEIRSQKLAYPLNLDQFKDGPEDRFINREGFYNRAPLLAISVQDSGMGISPENMARMFEGKFTTKPVNVGTGLGLSIVKRLIKEANGALHLHSKQGRGCTFTICLQTRE